MQIAIGQPIGYQGGAGGAVGVFDYLLSDTFTTDRAAGAVHGTDAEPGPGVRSVVDTNNALALVGGQAVFTPPGVSNGDPGIVYGAIGRAAGVVMETQVNVAAGLLDTGWIGVFSDGIRLSNSLSVRQVTTLVAVGASAYGTTYQLMTIVRSSGFAYFIKGGSYTNWTLIWMHRLGVENPLVAYVRTNGATLSAACDYVRIPAARWLPAPVLSDGFSALASSDGLGHLEGQNGAALGAGGAGAAWTATVGTWAVTGGVAAASALASGRAIRTADCGEADVLITAKCTLASGTMSIIVRWVDESNHIQLRLTSANRQLVKVVGGVSTTVSDTAYTYAAGAELRLICEGTKFRTYYNGAAVGAEFTISDAALQSATVVGLRTDNTGNTFDDLVVYARGSGGEYNTALDAI